MVSRGFFALQNTVLPMVVSSVAAACSVPLYWLLMKQFGAPGIALVGSLFMTSQFVVLLGLWTKRYQGGAELKRLTLALAKVVMISVVGCGVCWGIAREVEQLALLQKLGPPLRSLLVIGASGTPAMALVVLAFDWLGVADFRSLLGRFRARPTAS
jgi:putative peptidoglycan lipid II flippase